MEWNQYEDYEKSTSNSHEAAAKTIKQQLYGSSREDVVVFPSLTVVFQSPDRADISFANVYGYGGNDQKHSVHIYSHILCYLRQVLTPSTISALRHK